MITFSVRSLWPLVRSPAAVLDEDHNSIRYTMSLTPNETHENAVQFLMENLGASREEAEIAVSVSIGSLSSIEEILTKAANGDKDRATQYHLQYLQSKTMEVSTIELG